MCAVIAVSASAEPLPDKPFFEEPFLFGVHRGGAKWRPESTLKTFQEAAKTWPGILLESDVRMTSDGVVVLLHDATVNRTTNGEGAVADRTWEYLQTLDAGYTFTNDGGETFPYRGKGYRIPKLEEVLKALPESRFLIEFKDQPGIADATVAIMQQANAVDRILVASFNPDHMVRAATLEPRLATCFDSNSRPRLVETLRNGDWANYEPEDDVFILNYARIERYGITAEDFPRIRAKGIPIIVYTLDEPDVIGQAISEGVNGMLTDRPDVMSTVPPIK
ncbi:MAG: glycerophosphoryl diester phosphodiesterase [Phycisphaerae bacterium]|nr:MAG: glycerophosphoryl diester phosphodiesterase [Phycisphaerae bacterium]